MIYASVSTITGQVIAFVEGDDSSLAANKAEFTKYVEYSGTPIDCWYDGTKFIAVPEAPSKYHIFNWTTKKYDDTKTLDHWKAEVAAIRDDMLYASDWTQLPDSPLSADVVAAYKIYRQKLRDVTAQPGYPTAVVYPQEPAVH